MIKVFIIRLDRGSACRTIKIVLHAEPLSNLEKLLCFFVFVFFFVYLLFPYTYNILLTSTCTLPWLIYRELRHRIFWRKIWVWIATAIRRTPAALYCTVVHDVLQGCWPCVLEPVKEKSRKIYTINRNKKIFCDRLRGYSIPSTPNFTGLYIISDPCPCITGISHCLTPC